MMPGDEDDETKGRGKCSSWYGKSRITQAMNMHTKDAVIGICPKVILKLQ